MSKTLGTFQPQTGDTSVLVSQLEMKVREVVAVKLGRLSAKITIIRDRQFG